MLPDSKAAVDFINQCHFMCSRLRLPAARVVVYQFCLTETVSSCFPVFQLLEGSFTSQVSHEVDGLIFQPCGVSLHLCLTVCHFSKP